MELEHIRLAAALLHTVPDAALLLTYADGTVVSVSFGPGADLDPCSLRSLVGAAIALPRAECDVPIPSDRIEVSVRCDAALGVSVGVVRLPESDLAYLEDVAVRAQAACLVEELVSTRIDR